MTITKYFPACSKNIPGNDRVVFLAPVGDVTSITLTSGAVSALTLAGAPKFKRVRATIDTVQFTGTGSGSTNYAEDQTLKMSFSKKSVLLVALKNEIVDEIACGILAIRVDGNRQAWISGISPAAVEGVGRPFTEIETNFDSGLNPTEAGNELIMTLKRKSTADEYPFDATLNATILGGTATFIDWT